MSWRKTQERVQGGRQSQQQEKPLKRLNVIFWPVTKYTAAPHAPLLWLWFERKKRSENIRSGNLSVSFPWAACTRCTGTVSGSRSSCWWSGTPRASSGRSAPDRVSFFTLNINGHSSLFRVFFVCPEARGHNFWPKNLIFGKYDLLDCNKTDFHGFSNFLFLTV